MSSTANGNRAKASACAVSYFLTSNGASAEGAELVRLNFRPPFRFLQKNIAAHQKQPVHYHYCTLNHFVLVCCIGAHSSSLHPSSLSLLRPLLPHSTLIPFGFFTSLLRKELSDDRSADPECSTKSANSLAHPIYRDIPRTLELSRRLSHRASWVPLPSSTSASPRSTGRLASSCGPSSRLSSSPLLATSRKTSASSPARPPCPLSRSASSRF
jgi:hypothetical protein